MMPDDVQTDPLLAALSELPTLDVNARRAQHLGARCRSALATPSRLAATTANAESAPWVLVAGPALLFVWCAIYVIEIARHAATVYGF